MKKIDIHMHCFHHVILPHTGASDRFMQPNEVLEMYNRLGVEQGILQPIVSPEYMNSIQGNEEIMEIVDDYPGYFRWFCNIDPRNQCNNTDSDFYNTLRYYKEHGALGVGEITANLMFDDELVQNLFHCCELVGMPVLFHIGPHIGSCYGLVDEPGLPRLEMMLQKFPKLLFIAHSQPFWAEISVGVTNENRNTYPKGKVVPGRAVELLRKYPNLTGDLSANSGFNALKRDPEFAVEFLEEFQDKLFFGTDICSTEDYIGLSPWLDKLLAENRISQTAYEKICRKNAELFLIGRCKPW